MRLFTDELNQWIGREFNYTAPEEIGRASIRYFALAIGDDNPLYFDDEYARAAGYAGVIAPPTFICETNQYAHRQPNADGYIGHSWDLPLNGCRMIRGGHAYEFSRPVRPDDRLNVNWRLEDISEHNSSRGGTLLIVTATATFSDQRGEMLASNRETLIFQPLQERSRNQVSGSTDAPANRRHTEGADASLIAKPIHAAELHVGERMPPLERKIDLVRMIAYAGATWDWARLHYDSDYIAARHLQAPVIDGQMVGAMLSEGLVDWLGQRTFISKLSFRLRAMAFAGDTLRCEGEVTELARKGEHRLVKVAQRAVVGGGLVAHGTADVRLPA